MLMNAHGHLNTHSQIYFHEQLWGEGFCSQIHLWDSLFCSMRTFFLLFSPSFSFSVQFPAALLSLSFSLLHLSFLTHSRGVRFLQLVHISAPISRTPLPLSVCVSAPLLSLLLLLLYLMLTSACPGWPWGLQWAKRGWLILAHSCNVSHLLHS